MDGSINNPLNKTNDSQYPREFYEGQDSKSVGFVQPNKVNTGATRGDLAIKGRIVVTDKNNVAKLVLGYDPGKF